MLKAIASIIFFVFIFFFIEYFIFNDMAPWLKPDLLLLLTMFLTLSLGIRFGLLTAVVCGVLRDSFGLGLFGVHIFSYLISAYMTAILRKHVYIVSVQWFRFVIATIVSLINVFIVTIFTLMRSPIDWGHFWGHVALPEVGMTVLAVSLTFDFLKKCVSKFFV